MHLRRRSVCACVRVCSGICVHTCVCVCVRERQREQESERRSQGTATHTYTSPTAGGHCRRTSQQTKQIIPHTYTPRHTHALTHAPLHQTRVEQLDKSLHQCHLIPS